MSTRCRTKALWTLAAVAMAVLALDAFLDASDDISPPPIDDNPVDGWSTVTSAIEGASQHGELGRVVGIDGLDEVLDRLLLHINLIRFCLIIT